MLIKNPIILVAKNAVFNGAGLNAILCFSTQQTI